MDACEVERDLMDGEKLKELRKDAKMTQQDLASQLSLSVQTIKTYEQGRSDPDDETKLKIAKLFNVSLDYLLGATDEQLPLCHTSNIQLPRNFPVNEIPKVKDYIKLIMDAKK